MSVSTAGVGPGCGQLGEDGLAECVAGTRERERSVRVQALETAAPGRAADSRIELGPNPSLLRLCRRQARGELSVVGRGARPPLDAARSFETRDRRHEVTAGHPVLRRERPAVLVERLLLRHRRPAERAPHGDGAKRAGRPAELALDELAIAGHRLMMLAPGRDALDDEEPLDGFDEAEPPCLAHELLRLAGLR